MLGAAPTRPEPRRAASRRLSRQILPLNCPQGVFAVPAGLQLQASNRPKGEEKANRDTVRLKTLVTLTKQTIASQSNRDTRGVSLPRF